MIYRLEFENFHCFREHQVLDLTVPQTVPDEDDGRLAPIFYGSDIRVPKVVAIFGANGSGKSTVLRALTHMLWFITQSHTRQGFPDIPQPFNGQVSNYQPIRIAFEVGDIMSLDMRTAENAVRDASSVSHGVYRYEVIFNPDNTGARKVCYEALKQRVAGRGKWKRVFERNEQGQITGSENFNLSGYAKIIDKIPTDASLIPVLASFSHEPSQVIVNWAGNGIFTNMILDKFELDDNTIANVLASNPKILEALNTEIQKIDTGVQNIIIKPGIQSPVLLFEHEGLYHEMPWFWESTGTRSFIRIFPYLYGPIINQGLAAIDELDSALHPAILSEILNWYYNASHENAQLLLTCQNPSLLDELTKEEIVLCEKKMDGSSEIYSVTDVASVRRNDNFYKKYLSGNYGAIPHVG